MISLIISIALIFSSLFFPISIEASSTSCSIEASDQPIYDEFNGDSLDRNTWLVAEKSWGGENGGVVPANVSVSNGTLKLEGHGNYYTGDVEGLNKTLPKGIRTGAAIATREYYSPNSKL